MLFRLQKATGILFALIAGSLIFGFIFWGINYSLDEPKLYTIRMMLVIPAVLFLAVYAYLFLSSINMAYKTEEDGLHIIWGIRNIIIPWSEIEEIIQVKGKSNLFSVFGTGWPGHMIGLYMAKGLGSVRMYATRPQEGFIYIKSSHGFYGLTPVQKDEKTMLDLIAEKTGHEVKTVDMDMIDPEIKGENMYEDPFYKILFWLNIVFLAIFGAYLGMFYPGSGVSHFIILLPVLAVALFFFSISNAGRLYQFSANGGYILLLIGVAVTGIFMILAISEISL
ncbi:MAG: PH domain-containing protein [Deltaproteobacteria bacterium]